MTSRKFKLHELDTPEHLQWELEHEANRELTKLKKKTIKRGGATENISLLRKLAESQRQLLRDNQEIKNTLKQILEHMQLQSKTDIEKEFCEVLL